MLMRLPSPFSPSRVPFREQDISDKLGVCLTMWFVMG